MAPRVVLFFCLLISVLYHVFTVFKISKREFFSFSQPLVAVGLSVFFKTSISTNYSGYRYQLFVGGLYCNSIFIFPHLPIFQND